MKRKIKIKEFLMRKKVAAGCVAAAAVIAAGSFSVMMQSSDIPELSSYTDPMIETTITGDDTPLASKPKVTTKTTSKTKTTRKKVKLKKASKKSYTKKLPNKKKTTTKTKKSGKTTVKTQTTVQTTTSEKYTKKSKQKVVTEKVVTTVKTTTTVANTQQGAQTESLSAGTQSTASTSASSTKVASKQTISNVASIAPKMDSRVLNAYSRMGFTVTVDPDYAYAGHFDARSRNITMQEADETVYHELGHFLAFIAGNVDQGSAFKSVYNSEKSKFTGYNKAYATQNASEYFAESVKDYMLNGDALSSQRPETYKAIQAALNTVTTARADAILKAYASIWN